MSLYILKSLATEPVILINITIHEPGRPPNETKILKVVLENNFLPLCESSIHQLHHEIKPTIDGYAYSGQIVFNLFYGLDDHLRVLRDRDAFPSLLATIQWWRIFCTPTNASYQRLLDHCHSLFEQELDTICSALSCSGTLRSPQQIASQLDFSAGPDLDYECKMDTESDIYIKKDSITYKLSTKVYMETLHRAILIFKYPHLLHIRNFGPECRDLLCELFPAEPLSYKSFLGHRPVRTTIHICDLFQHGIGCLHNPLPI